MKAKVPKCHSLGIKSSTGRPFDPCLTLHKLSTNPIKFLGHRIQVPMDNSDVRSNLHSRLLGPLERVDDSPVTGKQKLLLYRAGICPCIMWDLTISRLSITWVSTLEAEATRFLKKWVGLARSANPSSLYLPKTKAGMGLPSITALFKKQQISHASQLISSRDPVVRHSATKKITSELQMKRVSFKPMVMVRDTLATDPGMSSKKLSKVSRNILMEDDAEERYLIMLASQCRGEVL